MTFTANYPGSSNYKIELDVYTISTDIPNNRSTVRADLWMNVISSAGYYNLYNHNSTITVNGTTYTKTNTTFDGRTTGRKLLYGTVDTVVNHNADGTKSISVSATHNTGTGLGNGSVSGTFTCNTIPRQAQITSLPNFNVGDNLSVGISNPGSMTMNMFLYVNGVADVVTRSGITGGNYTFTFSSAEKTAIYNTMKTVKSAKYSLYIQSYSGGTYIGQSSASATCYVVNSNPIFTTFTLKDTDTIVKTVIGDDTKIVKNQSNLSVECSSATGVNSATISSYSATLNGVTKSSATTTINFGTVNEGGTLYVRAIDSRGNYTEVSQTLTLISYSDIYLQTITLSRKNLIEEETTLAITGSYELLTIGGVDKNSIEECKYRYKETTSGTWGSYTTITPTTSGTDISYSGVIGNFNTDKSYDFEVYIKDKLSNYTISGILTVGTPLMSFRKGMVGIGKIPEVGKGEFQCSGVDIREVLYDSYFNSGNVSVACADYDRIGIYYQVGTQYLYTECDYVDGKIVPLISGYMNGSACSSYFCEATINDDNVAIGTAYECDVLTGTITTITNIYILKIVGIIGG